jgi:hypothetical protein
MLSKTQPILIAAAVLVTTLTLASTASAQSGDGAAGAVARHPDPLVGSWIVTVTPDGGSPFTTINNFNVGGTFNQLENQAGGPRPALGQWVRTGDFTYHTDFMIYGFARDEIGTWTGTLTVHVDITLGEHLEDFTAVYEAQGVFTDGTVTSGHGTREGRRAHFEFEP